MRNPHRPALENDKLEEDENKDNARLTCSALNLAQTRLNSRPSTKLGSVINSSPNTRMGSVIRRPRNDLGVISPYPTVVIAVGQVSVSKRSRNEGEAEGVGVGRRCERGKKRNRRS